MAVGCSVGCSVGSLGSLRGCGGHCKAMHTALRSPDRTLVTTWNLFIPSKQAQSPRFWHLVSAIAHVSPLSTLSLELPRNRKGLPSPCTTSTINTPPCRAQTCVSVLCGMCDARGVGSVWDRLGGIGWAWWVHLCWLK